MNLGAKLGGRIKQTLRYALGTAAFFSIVWTVLSLAAPMLVCPHLYDPYGANS